MDWWQILGYILGIFFNMGLVASFRLKAYDVGKGWLQSGRFAVAAVFALAVVELLVTGQFEALKDSAAFLDLLNKAWIMAAGSIGAQTTVKGIVRGLTQ